MAFNPYDHNARHTDVMAGFLFESRRNLLAAHGRIAHCVAQLSEEQMWWRPAPAMNSVANLLLHLSGNVGQWVISAIENSPATRDRPSEFAQRGPIAKAVLETTLTQTVERAGALIIGIKAADQLLAPRRIQGNDTCVLTAIYHAVAHFEGHAQEIIGMTRQMLGERYKFLWMPQTAEQKSGRQ
ncbi:MAG TPA: DUF1572 family protein [Phycisphaerae bacterium]|jgi:hypothetical protein|nr:DUF1572 family protein [Phycisphaerae bacterium]